MEKRKTGRPKNTTLSRSKSDMEPLPKLEIVSVGDPIPIAKIIELRNKKLSYSEIGRVLGCSEQNIYQRLQPFVKSIDNLRSVKENRADTLTVISDSFLNSLTKEDIQKSSAYQKVGMYGILYDKERLERGQSTSNVMYADITRDIKDLDKEIAELEAELGSDIGDDDAS